MTKGSKPRVGQNSICEESDLQLAGRANCILIGASGVGVDFDRSARRIATVRLIKARNPGTVQRCLFSSTIARSLSF